jgi:two-component system response regulator AtoC
MEKLMAYSFPGNIRELENILERAMIYGGGDVIRPDDIELRDLEELKLSPIVETAPSAPSQTPPPLSMSDIKKQAVIDALARNDGNRTHAAQALGISRKTLLNKIKEYGLS